MESTVIIASKRKGHDMWEGYRSIPAQDAKAYMAELRLLGRVCKKFADIIAYRADVDHTLAKLGY